MGSHKVHSLQDLLSWTSPDVHPGYISGVSCVGMVMLAQEKSHIVPLLIIGVPPSGRFILCS